MIDLSSNVWAVTIGGGVVASVAAGYVLDAFSKKKDNQEKEAHLKARLKYAYELRESATPAEALGVCEDLLTEVSEVKYPVLYGEVKTLAGELRRQIRAGAPPLVAQAPQTFPADARIPAVQTMHTSGPPPREPASSPSAILGDIVGLVHDKLMQKREELRKDGHGRKRKKLTRRKLYSAIAVMVFGAFGVTLGSLPDKAADTLANFVLPLLAIAFVISQLLIRYRFQNDEEPEGNEKQTSTATPGLQGKEAAPEHPLYSPIGDLFSSLYQEMEQVPKDLTGSFTGILSDLQALREKATRLNAVWKNTRKLLDQMPPESATSALPQPVQEQEIRTKKNLENLKAHIDVEMAETAAMLRALLAQVMQLKAAPRLTAPDSYSQIRDNLKQRLLQLETVEESFNPMQSWKEKS